MIISFYNVGGTPGPGPTPTPTGDTATTALLNSIIDGSVTDLHIGTGCTSIRNEAFVYCNDLQEVVMDSVATIGENAFTSCSSITSVEFSSALTSIGNYAFANNDWTDDWQLSHLIFHNPVPPSVETSTFAGCNRPIVIDCPTEGLTAYTAIDWSEYGISWYTFNTDKPDIVTYKTSDKTAVTPSGVTPVDNYHYASGICYMTFASALTEVPTAFMSGATGLTQIEFNNAVTGIGANAFTDCTGLASVDFGGAQSIGNGALSGCTGLSVLNFHTATPPTVGSNVFDGLPSTGTITCPVNSVGPYEAWLSSIAAISAWTVNRWVRLDTIDNNVAFDAIAWSTFYTSWDDKWVAETSGITSEESDWTAGLKASKGWFGDHRWNNDCYAQQFVHGAEDDTEAAAQDVDRNTLPNPIIYVNEVRYDTYMLDLTAMPSYVPLYGASSDPSWYTISGGMDKVGDVLVHLVEAPGQ